MYIPVFGNGDIDSPKEVEKEINTDLLSYDWKGQVLVIHGFSIK